MASQRYFVFTSSHNKSRKTSTPVSKSIRLLDQLRKQIRCPYYSLWNEVAYVYWMKKLICFHHERQPLNMRPKQSNPFVRRPE